MTPGGKNAEGVEGKRSGHSQQEVDGEEQLIGGEVHSRVVPPEHIEEGVDEDCGGRASLPGMEEAMV